MSYIFYLYLYTLGGRVDCAVRNIVIGDVHVLLVMSGASDEETQAGWGLC